ncbi:carbamoyl-phosphate synthase [Synechococcus sp. LTW-R]|uniref:carbamoyl-phosphate synthase n=1 Tax=Synechococcus sp. LTW-R TaxID=2751170 RepID=UPI0021042ADD|nr:carbamoyl-phosphate synthase [Synechococcus sp. LTW-R]
MQRSLHLSLSLSGVAALLLSNGGLLPAAAQEASGAEDLGVMSISLEDVVKPTIGIQGALQGAGTPNQAGIGGFWPLSVGDNSVWFLDALANINFADREGESSIINTDVAGTTISTSSRLGYRWLNGDRSWMFGINGGYDSRPMNTGGTDTGVNVSGAETSAFFQQVAVNAEAVSNDWNFNAYALITVGDTEQKLNWFYQGGALDTYGLDVGYFITPAVNASVGYYYQNGDMGEVDGAGVLGRLAYEISNGLTAGVNISYDEAFDTRVSADLKVRFGGASTTVKRKDVHRHTVINALTSTPSNRDVRVHDGPVDDPDNAWAVFLQSIGGGGGPGGSVNNAAAGGNLTSS